MYAIYITQHPKDRSLEAVLLRDGCYTSESNCYRREFEHVCHKPRLFNFRGEAKNFAHKHGYTGPRNRIHKYTGPTEPWDRH